MAWTDFLVWQQTDQTSVERKPIENSFVRVRLVVRACRIRCETMIQNRSFRGGSQGQIVENPIEKANLCPATQNHGTDVNTDA